MSTSPALLTIAWVVALVFGSIAPDVLFRAVLRFDVPAWAGLPAQAIGLVLLLGLTWILPILGPLRGFIWSLLLIQVGYVIAYAIGDSASWARLMQARSPGARFIATEMLKTIPSITLAASLVGSGLGPRDVFLAPGNIHAIAHPTWITGPMPWTSLGPILLMAFAIPLALYVAVTRGSQPKLLFAAARLAPLIIAGSAVNSFNEEFIFRAVRSLDSRLSSDRPSPSG